MIHYFPHFGDHNTHILQYKPAYICLPQCILIYFETCLLMWRRNGVLGNTAGHTYINKSIYTKEYMIIVIKTIPKVLINRWMVSKRERLLESHLVLSWALLSLGISSQNQKKNHAGQFTTRSYGSQKSWKCIERITIPTSPERLWIWVYKNRWKSRWIQYKVLICLPHSPKHKTAKSRVEKDRP